MDNATATKTETTDDSSSIEASGAFAKIMSIATELIDPSPYQNRKAFGGTQDDELAESVAAHGIIVALQVRAGKKAGRYELVFGERRLRAAKKVKLAEVPAQIVVLGDEEAAERLLVENLQRRDLNALEEAEGYRRLLDKHEHTMDSLATTTGKSKAHLYGRLKLLELASGPKKALAAGELPQQHAEIIARIGDAKLQEQCTRIVLGKLDRKEDDALLDQMNDIRHEEVSEDGKYTTSSDTSILSFRATQALIRRYFTTRLAVAKFDPIDASLPGGACSTCPHRSGNQPGLPGMLGANSDDLCTLASCFAGKTKAQFERQAAAAKAAGREVISAKEAADDIFAVDGVSVMQGSKYVETTTQLPYEVMATNDAATKAKTWGKLLGKDLADVPRVLVQDASGAAREMIDVTAAKKLLVEKGKIDDPKAKKAKPSTSSDDAVVKREKDKRELAKLALPRLLEQVAERAEQLSDAKETALWRWIARAVIGEHGDDEVADRRDLKSGKDLLELADKLRSVRELRALVVETLIGELADVVHGMASKHDKVLFDDGLELLGADWDKALALAKAGREAERAVDAKKTDDKPATAKKTKKGGKK